MEDVIVYLTEEAPRVWKSLGERGLRGRTVTVKLRSEDFTTATRQTSLPEPLESAEQLGAVSTSLLERFDFDQGTRYRLAGLGVSGFEDPDEAQMAIEEGTRNVEDRSPD